MIIPTLGIPIEQSTIFFTRLQNIVADHQIWLINQQVFKITDYVYFSSFFCIAVVNSCAL